VVNFSVIGVVNFWVVEHAGVIVILSPRTYYGNTRHNAKLVLISTIAAILICAGILIF